MIIIQFNVIDSRDVPRGTRGGYKVVSLPEQSCRGEVLVKKMMGEDGWWRDRRECYTQRRPLRAQQLGV